MQRRQSLFAFVVLCVAVFLSVSSALGQINTATLSGNVTDPQGLAVRGAKVTVTLLATGASRTANVDDAGHYSFVGLVPGIYKLHAEGTNFSPYENPSLQLTVGEQAAFNVKLALGTQTQVVTVTTETAPIEVTRSESSQTVDERQIDNLPINGRNYINFTLINSQTNRDNSNAIGPAPNSGLNISGSRARSNMVSVDGADAVDNTVDGIRSTVSQEAVQEFQMILSNYNAEYGRATGGVVNIVTKSGSNDFHGDVFGYLRNKAFQARNPFSGEVDPTTGDLVPTKQAYTRVQTGLTFGGALKKDKTFYFFSYEYTQREETGFSSIGVGNFGLQSYDLPTPAGTLPVELTPSQITAVNSLLTVNPTLAVQYGLLMGSASSVALNGLDYGALVTKLSGGTITPVNPVVTPGGTLFREFPFPVSCPTGTVVNSINCNGFAAIGPNSSAIPAGAVPLPTSYAALNALRGNFPEFEKTNLYSVRLDQHWSPRNSSFLRVGFSPSQVFGIQSTSQNQVYGQNAPTRVGAEHYRDVNATFEHDTVFDDTTYNEFRFQFARRGLHFGYSPLDYSGIGGDSGSDIGVNIPGIAYFGQEPYSPVDRIERRFQFTDNLTKTYGRHTFKIGVDFNLLQLRSAKQQFFQLDFGGDVTFGGLPADTFGLQDNVGGIAIPGATALQAYGLGLPTEYIQGIGTSNQPFDNIPIAFYAQDSWRATSKLTFNYGIRYEVAITPLFAPATAINAAAEQALGVTEGLPRHNNYVVPRFGLAWDPKGDGKTVVRAGYGMFYDNPLLAIAFDSTTADGGRSVQLLSAGGNPTACGIIPTAAAPPGYATCGGGFDSPANLNGSSIFQGTLNALPSMYYEPNQSRFNPYPTDSIFANQNYLNAGVPLPILPFTLPVERNFQYGYAQQANLTIERQIAGTWKLSVGYQWTQGSHLYRPIDVNSTDPQLLTTNLYNADASGLSFSSPVTVVVPTGTGIPGSCLTTGANSSLLLIAPGALALGYPGSTGCTGNPIGYIGTPSYFNFFRPSGPNPSYALATAAPATPGSPCFGLTGTAAFNCGYGVQQGLAHAAGFPVGFGVPVPFNSVDAQASDATSSYNALTVNLQKSFSRHFTMLSSYTWSHSIDNGTDLQSTLEPQDSRFPYLERASSVNDQRHRWVLSGVYQTSPQRPGESFVNNFFSNFTVAPLIEVSSGRPYTVISNEDTRLELSASNDRPSIAPVGTPGATTSPYIPGVAFVPANVCLTNAGKPFTVPGITPYAGCDGSLGRDTFTTPMFFQFDLRVSKGIPIGERLRLDLIADMFNLFNHTNISAVNPVCDPTAGSTCLAGQPTAAFDARQFQFALKLSW